MKKLPRFVRYLALLTLPLAFAPAMVMALEPSSIKASKIGFVNFKTCIENSKLGQQEQTTFDMIKKQMESSLEDKEKSFKEKRKPYDDLKTKLEDDNFIDSLSPEAEKDLKLKIETLTSELSQMQMQNQELQNQYYQALQQANTKILQKLAETVMKASSSVAKELQLDTVLNEDGCFYFNSDYEISDLVVKEMDVIYDKEIKEMLNKSTPLTPNVPAKGNW